jgi:hypothetical protein
MWKVDHDPGHQHLQQERREQLEERLVALFN